MSRHLFGIPYISLQGLIYPNQRYKTFSIKKRNGADRIISEPTRALKNIQLKLLDYLYQHSGQMKPCVHGFTFERSIVTNAKTHCSSKTQHLLNIDIEDFFPSISFYRVRGLLQKKPFEFSHHVATVLAQICTFNGALPQGAPTSPLIANLVCRSLDRDLMQLAKRHRATYTRYADDITLSLSTRDSRNLPTNICSFDSGVVTLGDEIRSIFTANSFRINTTKSRISTRSQRLEVTGITINEFPNVKRIFIDRIRGALHAWEKHGYSLAQTRWEQLIDGAAGKSYETRPWKRQRLSTGKPALKNVLWGKLLYLRMVRGKNDIIYTRLAEKFNELRAREKSIGTFDCPSLPATKQVLTKSDAEHAVFVVEWAGDYQKPGSATTEMVGGQGTAFAFKDKGLITCNHVLMYSETKSNGEIIETDAESTDVSNISLTVTNPATGKSWPVKITCRDKHRDLAILQFNTNPPPEHKYFSTTDAPIPINATGILIGFPNHTVGRRADFLTERVLNRVLRSALQRFDITGAGSIRKGNSGGPFVDSQYRVAGIAQQGATQEHGNDECLCVMELEGWLSTSVPSTTKTAAAAATASAPTTIATQSSLAPIKSLSLKPRKRASARSARLSAKKAKLISTKKRRPI